MKTLKQKFEDFENKNIVNRLLEAENIAKSNPKKLIRFGFHEHYYVGENNIENRVSGYCVYDGKIFFIFRADYDNYAIYGKIFFIKYVKFSNFWNVFHTYNLEIDY